MGKEICSCKHLMNSMTASCECTWVFQLVTMLVLKVKISLSSSCLLLSPSKCPVGSGVAAQCLGYNDTVCESCVNGHNYSRFADLMPCVPCSSCMMPNEIMSRPCSQSKDTECTCHTPFHRNLHTKTCVLNEQSDASTWYSIYNGQPRENRGVPSGSRTTRKLLTNNFSVYAMGYSWDVDYRNQTDQTSNDSNIIFLVIVVLSITFISVVILLPLIVLKVKKNRNARGAIGRYTELRHIVSDSEGSANSEPARGRQKVTQGTPIFTSPLRDGFVQVGKKAILECEVEGVPSPLITWSKDGHTVTSTDIITVDHTRLSMEPMAVCMAGRYKCEASNKFGSAVTYANVSVIGGFADLEEDLPSVETTINLGLSIVSPQMNCTECQPGPESLYNSELQEHFQSRYPGTTLKIVPCTDSSEWSDEGGREYLQRLTEQVSHYPGSLLEENEAEQRELRAKQIAELGYTELAIGHISGRSEGAVNVLNSH